MKRLVIIFMVCFLVISCGFRKKFEEVGFWKDRGNRVYSVYTSHTDWDLIREYATKKPWKPGRLTMVYFFNDRKNTPDISTYKVGYDIPKRYQYYLVAVYQHLGNGKEKFTKSPPKK